jgi:hypothetical protein
MAGHDTVPGHRDEDPTPSRRRRRRPHRRPPAHPRALGRPRGTVRAARRLRRLLVHVVALLAHGVRGQQRRTQPAGAPGAGRGRRGARDPPLPRRRAGRLVLGGAARELPGDRALAGPAAGRRHAGVVAPLPVRRPRRAARGWRSPWSRPRSSTPAPPAPRRSRPTPPSRAAASCRRSPRSWACRRSSPAPASSRSPARRRRG